MNDIDINLSDQSNKEIIIEHKEISTFENVITINNVSKYSNVIINLKNFNKDKINQLKLKCNKLCRVKIYNHKNLTIEKLIFENAYFIEQPNFSVNEFFLNSSQDYKTYIPQIRTNFFINYPLNKYAQIIKKNINALNIIPGSGEYVYDPIIQYKNINNQLIPINMNNDYNIADSMLNLEQLKHTLPNLKWVTVVVNWFAIPKNNQFNFFNKKNFIDIKNLDILPAIDSSEDTHTDNWQVAKYNKHNSYNISKNKDGKPNYGGTINDASLVRYVKLLKKNGYKVVIYPIFLIDLPNKPWRGFLNADNTNEISNFFNKENGINNFVLHYTKLLKNHIDAIIISSELAKLTSFRDKKYKKENINYYPTIYELVQLAKNVKNILGKDKIVTYAANWSEYHHNLEGEYPLDDLWMSKYIDKIGINAYFPLTETTQNISYQDIISGWQTGQYWDFYYDDNNERKRLNPIWSIKRIKDWWLNPHFVKNHKTSWQPKTKKIWFTEFGFPSIYKATKEPYFSYDKELNKNIHIKTDFELQLQAIAATTQYWSTYKNMVEKMFLWTWDARPYPDFPNKLEIWSDGTNWEKGHWINGKLDPLIKITILGEVKAKNIYSNKIIEFKNNHSNIKIHKISAHTIFYQDNDFLKKVRNIKADFVINKA